MAWHGIASHRNETKRNESNRIESNQILLKLFWNCNRHDKSNQIKSGFKGGPTIHEYIF